MDTANQKDVPERIGLLIGESIYDSLAVFIGELQRIYESKGYEVSIIDVTKADWKNSIKKLLENKIKFFLDFNGRVATMVAEIFNEMQVVYCAFLVDHPLWQHTRLLSKLDQYYVFTVDYAHCEYIEKNYPHIKGNAMINLGGIRQTEIKKYTDREHEVVFMGSYESPEKILDTIEELETEEIFDVKNIFVEVVKRILTDFNLTVDEAFDLLLKEYRIILVNRGYYLDFVHQYLHLADKYVRLYFRQLVIKTLVENGMQVHVYGKGWNEFQCNCKENLLIHEPVNYMDTLDVMQNSKIVLNVMPWFKKGSHDRIFNAMLTGAVCVTDSSTYIDEEFENNKDIVLYSLRELHRLPAILKGLLENDDVAEKIADAGLEKAMQRHTWECRAQEIIDFVEKNQQ